MTAAITETPAATLAAKIARISRLREENEADAPPLFERLLAGSGWTARAPIEREEG